MGRKPSGKTKAAEEKGLALGAATPEADGWAWAEPRKARGRSKPKPKAPVRVPFDYAVVVPVGARWLDVIRPGWYKVFASQPVDIQSVTGCPLSNAFADSGGRPSFHLGVLQLCRPTRVKVKPQSSLLHGPLSLTSQSSRPQADAYKGADTLQLASHGFAPDPDDPSPDPYPTINDLWKREVDRRMVRWPWPAADQSEEDPAYRRKRVPPLEDSRLSRDR